MAEEKVGGITRVKKPRVKVNLKPFRGDNNRPITVIGKSGNSAFVARLPMGNGYAVRTLLCGDDISWHTKFWDAVSVALKLNEEWGWP